MGDSCRQVSWLAARTLHPAFPARVPGPVADVDEARRLQLRGQPRIKALAALHRVPFSPVRVVARIREPARGKSNQTFSCSSSNRGVDNFVSPRVMLARNGTSARNRRLRHALWSAGPKGTAEIDKSQDEGKAARPSQTKERAAHRGQIHQDGLTAHSIEVGGAQHERRNRCTGDELFRDLVHVRHRLQQRLAQSGPPHESSAQDRRRSHKTRHWTFPDGPMDGRSEQS